MLSAFAQKDDHFLQSRPSQHKSLESIPLAAPQAEYEGPQGRFRRYDGGYGAILSG
jgi:hypothetical protein